jgi:hypothetical protein
MDEPPWPIVWGTAGKVWVPSECQDPNSGGPDVVTDRQAHADTLVTA